MILTSQALAGCLAGAEQTTRVYPQALTAVAELDAMPGDFDQALASCIPQLRGFIAKQVRSHQEIDDILQDTLLRSMQTGDKACIRNPLAYAIQVARSVVQDHWRRLLRQPLVSENDDTVDADSRNASPTLDEQQIHRQQLELLLKVLGDMPELRRKVFLLRRLDGLSREEIAIRLDMNDEAVKKHISRAMVTIATTMASHGY
jgi:RNA polymerase sigma factor (sigma-70 family)